MRLDRPISTPRLWASAENRGRRVTWLELFFDLVFVAAVAQVGAPLAEDYSPAGLVRYGFLFLLIWWAWSGHTLYTTRFDHDDWINRLLILLQCFVAAVMAANAREALDSRSSAGFGAAYAGMRLILAAQYLRARRVAETRALTTRYAAGFGAAALVWLISAFLEPPARYWMWGLALAIDFAVPWAAAPHSVRFPPDAEHFPERFGLFTIILLGEFVAGVMRGIEHQEYWSVAAASTAFLSLTFAFVARWWYFDVAKSASERHVRSRRQAWRFEVWHYAHLPLFLGVGVAGVGFERLISLGADEHLTRAEGVVLCSAAALLAAAMATIGAVAEKGRTDWRFCAQIALAAAVAVLGIVAQDLHRVALTGALVGAFAIQAAIGLTSRGGAESGARRGVGWITLAADEHLTRAEGMVLCSAAALLATAMATIGTVAESCRRICTALRWSVPFAIRAAIGLRVEAELKVGRAAT